MTYKTMLTCEVAIPHKNTHTEKVPIDSYNCLAIILSPFVGMRCNKWAGAEDQSFRC